MSRSSQMIDWLWNPGWKMFTKLFQAYLIQKVCIFSIFPHLFFPYSNAKTHQMYHKNYIYVSIKFIFNCYLKINNFHQSSVFLNLIIFIKSKTWTVSAMMKKFTKNFSLSLKHIFLWKRWPKSKLSTDK